MIEAGKDVTMVQPDRQDASAAGAMLRRAEALQNPLDRWLYHPLSGRLAAALAHTPVTPNMVSVAGGLMIVAAGIAYVQNSWPWFALAGLLLHMGWHVLDGADGDLARMTGRSSPVGEIVDGICDYLGHIALYVMIAWAAFPASGWSIAVAVVAAGASRIVQASYYESQRRQYLHWVHDTPWLRTSGMAERGLGGWSALRRIYLAIAEMFAPRDTELDRALADPEVGPAVKARLVAAGPSALAGSSLLGANYRTLLLGAAMFAGSPLAYFLYEAIILNLLLAGAIVRARRTRKTLLADLQPAASTLR